MKKYINLLNKTYRILKLYHHLEHFVNSSNNKLLRKLNNQHIYHYTKKKQLERALSGREYEQVSISGKMIKQNSNRHRRRHLETRAKTIIHSSKSALLTWIKRNHP